MFHRNAARIVGACALATVAAWPWGASAPAVRALRPLQRETPLPSHGLIGTLPQCEAAGQLDASNTAPRVGEVITVTVRARAQCPTLLATSAPLFVIGGVPQWAVPSVRDGLAEILRAVGAAGDAPIAYRLVGQDDSAAMAWATSAGDRQKASAALALRAARPGGAAAQWTAALAAADRAMAALPPRYRPLLVIVDGEPPTAGANGVVDGVGRLLGAASDMAGRGIVVDASDGGWLVERARLENTLPDDTIFIFAADHDPAWIAESAADVMAAYESPLTGFRAIIFADSPSLAVLSATPPEEALPGGDVMWFGTADGHTLAFDARARYLAVGDVGDATNLGLQVIPARGRVGGEAVDFAPLRVCIAPEHPVGDPCASPGKEPPGGFVDPPPTPTASPTPTPRRLFIPRLERP